jgi:predicted AAA+ superfamily ATPase
VTERLAGVEGGTPIFRLETGFGGGKSHALITTVHVAREGERLAEMNQAKVITLGPWWSLAFSSIG